MFDFIAGLLSWLYDLWPSYGGSIVLLTLVIMTVMAPVTIRQTRSMIAMQQLGPELKRLKAKHGDDRERLNQEMMALYQANGVNPLGGCLPILIQMPIFLVLFQVVRGLTRRVTDVGLAVGEATYSAGSNEVEFADRTFNPDFLSSESQLAQDLRATNEMTSLGLDLSESAQSALGESIIHGLPYLLLVIGVGVTTWLQQKQIQGRQTSAEVNPQQQMIMKVLPFMMPVFSFGFPAALVVYWFVSNLFRVGQQLFITKKVYGKKDDDYEIIRPTAVEQEKKKPNQTARQKSSSGKGKAGGNKVHGRRNPVSSDPPKKRKKPPAQPKPAKKRSKPEAPEPQARPTSKRVTPKKNVEPEPRTRRRDKKKKN
jgi:YidC/Oxa1 family membrane protein insertase